MPAPRLHPTRHLLRAKDVIDTRYSEPLLVRDLASVAGLSPAHFSREFRRVFGEAPHQYLLTRRLERAAALLRTTDWTVTRICFAVGLGSLGSFTTSFGDAYGVSPQQYRAAAPPVERMVRLPLCVVRESGRLPYRTFREAVAAAVP